MTTTYHRKEEELGWRADNSGFALTHGVSHSSCLTFSRSGVVTAKIGVVMFASQGYVKYLNESIFWVHGT